MLAQIHPIHQVIPPCHIGCHDNAELVSTVQNSKQFRSKKRLLSVRQSEMDVSGPIDSIQKKSRSNNKRQPLITKRVHFEVDENDEIVSHIQNPNEELVITEEEIKAMWWREKEAIHFKRRARAHSQAYKAADSEDSSYITRFNEAWKVCSKSAGHIENVPLMSNTKVRGLEMYIFPEVLVKQRQRVIHSVLKIQSKIPASMNSDDKARLLNAASKGLTRPMRRLSRLLAIGDARLVAQLDTPEYSEDDFH